MLKFNPSISGMSIFLALGLGLWEWYFFFYRGPGGRLLDGLQPTGWDLI
jgi:hypothetical protein